MTPSTTRILAAHPAANRFGQHRPRTLACRTHGADDERVDGEGTPYDDATADWWTMSEFELGDLVARLVERFDEVIGPVVDGGVIRLRPITGIDDIPVGVGDQQEAASYRLVDTGTLEVATSPSGAGHWAAWQVVEFEGAGDGNVQRGLVTTMGTANLTATATIPTAVDVDRTFILADFKELDSA